MSSLETGYPDAEFHAGLSASRAHLGLQQALLAAQSAEKNALLWFADILQRKLFRELGYSSIQAYAGEALGFSPSKTSQFLRLAEALEALPLMRAAAATGEIPWTKLRELARVATPASEREWVAEARCSSRRALAAKVTQVKEQARRERHRDPAQRTLDEVLGAEAATAQPGSPVPAGPLPGGAVAAAAPAGAAAAPSTFGWATAQAPAEAPPCAVTLRLDGIQLARFDALMAKARKHRVKLSREELLLQALAAFVEGAPGSRSADSGPDQYPFTRVNSGCGPRNWEDPVPELATRADSGRALSTDGLAMDASGEGMAAPVSPRSSSVPAQVIIYKCKDCGRAEVVTSQGRRTISPSTLERIECDAIVQTPEGHNRATIPPKVRRAVLARGGHRCQVRGCGRTQNLEIHHIRPRSEGGSNKPDNLAVVCGLCHPLLHDKGLASPLLRPAGVPSSAPRKDQPGS